MLTGKPIAEREFWNFVTRHSYAVSIETVQVDDRPMRFFVTLSAKQPRKALNVVAGTDLLTLYGQLMEAADAHMEAARQRAAEAASRAKQEALDAQLMAAAQERPVTHLPGRVLVIS